MNLLPLTSTELQRLTDYLVTGLIDRGLTMEKDIVTNLIIFDLITFSRHFDLAAFYRFFDWAQVNRQDQDDMIFSTLMHDLNGIFEDPSLFSPKTSTY